MYFLQHNIYTISSSKIKKYKIINFVIYSSKLSKFYIMHYKIQMLF